MEKLINLRQRYHFPSSKPDVPENDEGWFNSLTNEVFKKYINDGTKIVVEIGSWMGASTRALLEVKDSLNVISIDHWEGSREHKLHEKWSKQIPTLYDTFLVNCWKYKDRLTPVKLDSVSGLVELSNFEIKPDIIFIDASHDYRNVYNDLTLSHRLFPEALIIGDDWHMAGVKKAVTRFIELYDSDSVNRINITVFRSVFVLEISEKLTHR